MRALSVPCFRGYRYYLRMDGIKIGLILNVNASRRESLAAWWFEKTSVAPRGPHACSVLKNLELPCIERCPVRCALSAFTTEEERGPRRATEFRPCFWPREDQPQLMLIDQRDAASPNAVIAGEGRPSTTLHMASK